MNMNRKIANWMAMAFFGMLLNLGYHYFFPKYPWPAVLLNAFVTFAVVLVASCLCDRLARRRAQKLLPER